MGRFGFILLLIGGALLIIAGASLTLDPATQAMLASLINTYVAPYVGIPDLGTLVIQAYVLVTSLGGIGVIAGAIIWYAIGYGCGASIGKLIVGLSTGSATVAVAVYVYDAIVLGVFSQPLHTIITYFGGLGIAFSSVFIVILGTIMGAGRRRPPKVVREPAPEKDYT